MHKMVVGLVLTFWKGCGFKGQLVPQLMTALTEDGGYEDLMPFLLAMQKDCHVSKHYQNNIRISSKVSASLIIQHPLPNHGK